MNYLFEEKTMEKPTNFGQAQMVAKEIGLEVKEVVRAFKIPAPTGVDYSSKLASELARAVVNGNLGGMNWVYDSALDDDIRAEALKARKKYCREILTIAVGGGSFSDMNWVYHNTPDSDVKAEALEAMNKYCEKKLARAMDEKHINNVWWVYHNTLDNNIKGVAVRNIVLLIE